MYYLQTFVNYVSYKYFLQLAPSKAPEAALVAWSFEWGSPQGGPREEEYTFRNNFDLEN